MAGPFHPTLLLLLLSLALGSAGQEAHGNGERIINGVVCPRGSHPWQVALYYNNTLQCAGVLINKWWVLTVAHCQMSDYIVQMGSDLLVGGRARKINATESFVHPWYDNRTDDHDIMLVKLSSPARLSRNVKKINLPSSCKEPETSCTVSGWGITTMVEGATFSSELMCSDVSLITYPECKLYYPTALKTYTICAAPPFGLGYPCTGDSGSPLICEGSLQGLVSAGYYPCSLPFEPVVYTRLCMYRKWISDTMKTNS
ncbi:kallikrein-7-like [Eptesicus fuscus]|uniref:kallikrein-7-like n=1 Tax=Eptesicus fuscus TaxID=29078 RepID=UPI002403A5E3|nr:kallikrein-7-like [Eptesicus fuscus]